MNRNPLLVVVIEHRHQLQSSSNPFKVLTKGRHPDIACMLELRYCSLCHFESPREFGLADSLGVT